MIPNGNPYNITNFTELMFIALDSPNDSIISGIIDIFAFQLNPLLIKTLYNGESGVTNSSV